MEPQVDYPAIEADPIEQQPSSTEEVSIQQQRSLPIWTEDTGIQIVRATRSWIQYGTVGFAVFCIVIGALEALFGR